MTQQIAIQVEGLSKRYRIGAIRGRHHSLGRRLAAAGAGPLRRLASFGRSSHREEDSIWALKDVSFQVTRGEVLGVVGANGAGKSTLLKILTRITHPTEGRARIWGRVGSLLEVGTGFHQELTGRENVFLSGAILGMRKREIAARFDDIVDFSGVDKFIDTPVKRYSSGMNVRLGFAVAAHMEPEVLLVDEVLAVGDLAFQKKCVGRMKDVAGLGRTVLYVSHNMGSIKAMCSRALLIDGGHLVLDTTPEKAISAYIARTVEAREGGEIEWPDEAEAPGCEDVRLRSIRLVSPGGDVQSMFEVGKPIKMEIRYAVKRKLFGMRVNVGLSTEWGETALVSTDQGLQPLEVEPGEYESVCTIPGDLLNLRTYVLSVGCGIPRRRKLIPYKSYLRFSTVGVGHHGAAPGQNWPGVVCPKLEWHIEKLS